MTIYYIKTHKLENGNLEEIALNNFEPEIERQFKHYNKKQLLNWEIYSEDDISDFNLDKNDITKYKSIIFMKRNIFVKCKYSCS